MNLEQKFNAIPHKLCLGKNDLHFQRFCDLYEPYCMHRDGFGMGLDAGLNPGNLIRGALMRISQLGGTILFNINGVDLRKAKKGFRDFDDAYDNNFITEWQLSLILSTMSYRKITIFHNGKVEFKKTILWKSIRNL